MRIVFFAREIIDSWAWVLHRLLKIEIKLMNEQEEFFEVFELGLKIFKTCK